MSSALIGYTGFVGSNLGRQAHFDFLYNSSNITDANCEEFDIVVCAAPSAEKWKANLDPDSDMKKINGLIEDVKDIRAGCYIQISTVDVYKTPYDVDELSEMDAENLHAYGKHRLVLEDFVCHNFKKHLVIRLPALFGPGLKKNFIYDMLNNNCLEMTDMDSAFQFYSLEHLWGDINIALRNSIQTLNITSEPVSAREVAMGCFGVDFQNKTQKPPAAYNVKSRYYRLFNGKNGYLYSKAQVLEELKNFVVNYR